MNFTVISMKTMENYYIKIFPETEIDVISSFQALKRLKASNQA
jgi:hypothetical protein